MDKYFDGKKILVTGGTGSLGQVLVRRLLSGEMGTPAKVVILSRDEAKQYLMKMSWKHRAYATDDIYYHNFEEMLEFRIGDVRDFNSVLEAMRECQVVCNAAAMKQVPICEYFPFQAVQTNVMGAENIVRAASMLGSVELIVGMSTDKACAPINAMGLTKALQERIFVEGNLRLPGTKIVCVRYGNVIASRGSVIPLFREQIINGGPLTVTVPEMTRFLLTLNEAVDTIFSAARFGARGEIYIPKLLSARIIDIARMMIGDRNIDIKELGIRPGEKLHEILISEEESFRTTSEKKYYVIKPALTELVNGQKLERGLFKEFSSRDCVVEGQQLAHLLAKSDFKDFALEEVPIPRTTTIAR